MTLILAVKSQTMENSGINPEKSSAIVPCGVAKCQAIRLCVCKLSAKHNQSLNKHISISTGEGKKDWVLKKWFDE